MSSHSDSDDDFGPSRAPASSSSSLIDVDIANSNSTSSSSSSSSSSSAAPSASSVSSHKRKPAADDNDDDDDDFGPARPPPSSSDDPSSSSSSSALASSALPSSSTPIAPPAKKPRPTLRLAKHPLDDPYIVSPSAMSASFFRAHSSRLPSASMYERSYLHKDLLSHILVSSSHFVISGSNDGVVKFWKKIPKGLEFVKQYRSHLGMIGAMCISADGLLVATCAASSSSVGGAAGAGAAQDRSVKVYDVANFDMMHQLPDLGFVPLAMAFIHAPLARPVLAVTSRQDGRIYFFHVDGSSSSSSNSSMSAESSELVSSISSSASSSSAVDIHAPFFVQSLHSSPVHLLRYNPALAIVVSVDVKGSIEFWNAQGAYDFDSISPTKDGGAAGAGTRLGWQYKLDTDLYLYASSCSSSSSTPSSASSAPASLPLSLDFSPNGRLLAITSSDRVLRLFKVYSGKVWKKFDEESLDVISANQTLSSTIPALDDDEVARLSKAEAEKRKAVQEKAEMYHLDSIDFGRRMAIERELDKNVSKAVAALQTPYGSASQAASVGGGAASSHHSSIPAPASNIVWDESGCYILYPCMLGIKVLNIYTSSITRILGKIENTERFLCLSLYQRIPLEAGESSAQAVGSSRVTSSGNALEATQGKEDPCVFALGYRKDRFYWFSRREPEAEGATTGRDVFNEKPSTSTLLLNSALNSSGLSLSTAAAAAKLGLSANAQVVMHTSMGDITLQLHPEEAPLAVENFVTHSRSGYYSNVIFHRVIRDFMVQTGDPKGNGTGGKSIFKGGEFADEFNRSLRFDRPGVLAMANAGPNSNGSQFFITTVPCPWLDNKHTIFGFVTKGMDVVSSIEKTKEKDSKPIVPIRIVSMEIVK